MEIKQFTFGFDPYSTLFENLDLKITEPGIYGLLGRNSIGKTTLFNLLSKHLNNTFDFDVKTNEISYISDLDMLNTFKINHLILLLDGPHFNKAKCNQLMGSFQIPLNKRFFKLSKGAQSLVIIILTVCIDAKYYFFDEPYNFLDMYNKDQINTLLYQLQEENKIIMISSHQIKELEHLLSHVIILDQKKIVYQNTIDQLDYLQISEFNDNAIATFRHLGKVKYLNVIEDPCYEVNLTTLFSAFTKPIEDKNDATN